MHQEPTPPIAIRLVNVKKYFKDREVEALVMEREEARKRKDWAAADHIRDALRKIGVELTDTKEGTIWRRDEDSNTSSAKSTNH